MIDMHEFLNHLADPNHKFPSSCGKCNFETNEMLDFVDHQVNVHQISKNADGLYRRLLQTRFWKTLVCVNVWFARIHFSMYDHWTTSRFKKLSKSSFVKKEALLTIFWIKTIFLIQKIPFQFQVVFGNGLVCVNFWFATIHLLVWSVSRFEWLQKKFFRQKRDIFNNVLTWWLATFFLTKKNPFYFQVLNKHNLIGTEFDDSKPFEALVEQLLNIARQRINARFLHEEYNE